MIPLTDYARFVDERAHALAALLMSVIDGLTLEPLRAVDDARVTQDSEDDFEGKEETP